MAKIKVFCDAHLFCLSKERADVGDALVNADVCFADGRSVKILTGWEYCTGSEYFERVLNASREAHSKHYFYGATPETLERLATVTRDKFGATVVGYYSPAMTQELSWAVESIVLDDLERQSVDHFWVFLGGGKQEVWASSNKSKLPVGEILCVGAVADFYTGVNRRAPKAFRALRLEWLFRTFSSGAPRARRNFKYLVRMLGYLLRHRLNKIVGFT